MTRIFLEIINMSITASILALAVILLRLTLKRAPRWIVCVLWGFVALRLILPFSVESMFSLMPESDPIPAESIDPPKHNSEGVMTLAPNGVIYQDPIGETVSVPAGAPTVSVESIGSNSYVQLEYDPSAADILARVWAVGIAVMLLYTLASFFGVRRRVAESVLLKENIYICDRIQTPFILGILRPRIYLPSSMKETDGEFVISHERAHLRRGDHFWKPLGFLLLSMHWFNPLLWLCYILLCRDIEIACDEKVIREQGADIKKPYSEALVNCSVPRKMIAACPLAFGEVGVKERVKGVLGYKKPPFWIIIIAVIALIVTAVCFLTDPIIDTREPYTVHYFESLAAEREEPAVAQTMSIPAKKLAPMLKEVREQTWICDALANRIGKFYFDGMIEVGEYDIYFGFASKILYCDYDSHYFTDLTDEHADVLKAVLKENGIDADTVRLAESDTSAPETDAPVLSDGGWFNIYVCQFAKGNYHFTLADDGRQLTKEELWEMDSIRSLDRLRSILAEKSLTADDINIIPWQNPLSSYIAECWIIYPDTDQDEVRASYIAMVKELIFDGGELSGTEH